jgi:hypothetical protein
MKFYLKNLTNKFVILLKIYFAFFLFFLASETFAQMADQSSIQYICESKAKEAVGKCIVENGGGACVAEKIISNSSTWESCSVVDNQVNWTLYDQQVRAIPVCLPLRNQIYNSCMQNFYANQLYLP